MWCINSKRSRKGSIACLKQMQSAGCALFAVSPSRLCRRGLVLYCTMIRTVGKKFAAEGSSRLPSRLVHVRVKVRANLAQVLQVRVHHVVSRKRRFRVRRPRCNRQGIPRLLIESHSYGDTRARSISRQAEGSHPLLRPGPSCSGWMQWHG